MEPDKFMARALEIAGEAKDEAGALPYGAVVVVDGKIVGEGLNRAQALHDPTSHGEVEAIRDACRKLKSAVLPGAVMYTTAEPCPMCVATMILAGFERLVFAAGPAESSVFLAALAKDDPSLKRRYRPEEMRRQVGLPSDARDMPAERQGVAEAIEIFDGFAASRRRG